MQVLPESFVGECSFPPGRTFCKLVDGDGNSWKMYSVKNSRSEMTLHRKFWALFSLQHFLEEGNVCVFELTQGETLAIVVHIFRVVAISAVNKSDSVRAHYDVRKIAWAPAHALAPSVSPRSMASVDMPVTVHVL